MDTNYYKEKLEEEKKRLEEGLLKIAKPDPEEPGDWETTPTDLNIMASDKNEIADVFEESITKEAVESELEERLNDVKDALKKIESGAYGVCETCGEKINEERLKAEPAAKNCIKHAKNS
ncbi:MAG: TraR/DksA C4-type zinc finger protein [Candidatus Pacebacteria bacterium]|nr:TraR/DksA C4-type zinc finger protein [Candidatus Paceibacterota bacterium]